MVSQSQFNRIILAVLILFSGKYYAQYMDSSFVSSYDTIGGFVHFKKSPLNESKTKILDAVFKLSNCEYRLSKTIVINEKLTHYRFKLYYKGVLVIGHDFSIHYSADGISGNGDLIINPINVNVSSNISEQEAISIALQECKADSYFWQDTLRENDIKEMTQNQDTSYYPKPSPCILNSKFCYKIRVFASKPLEIYDYYVQAQTGQVELTVKNKCGFNYSKNNNPKPKKGSTFKDSFGKDTRVNSIFSNDENSFANRIKFKPINKSLTSIIQEKHALCSCSGSGCSFNNSANIFFYGAQNINTDRWSGPPLSICYYRTKDVCGSTYLFARKWGTQNGYTNNSTNWGNSNSGGERNGTTALWVLERVYDYFYTTFGRDSYDNNSGQVNIYTESTSFNENNLEGGGSYIYPNTIIVCAQQATNTVNAPICIEIVGHEYAHMVIDNACQLTNTGETGAISESICDMFAVCIDNAVKGNSTFGLSNMSIDYLIADENFPGGIRNMALPFTHNQPYSYEGTAWQSPTSATDNGNVHTNMGVLNFWFYLLSVGGSGNNSGNYATSYPYCVKGIGQDKAIRIVYNAVTGILSGGNPSQLNSGTNFSNIRAQMVASAQQLYGVNSPEQAEVESAFYAVGIGYNGAKHQFAQPPLTAMPYVFIGNKTESSSKIYNFNNQVRHKNYIVNGGANVDVSSYTEVLLLPGVDIFSCNYYGYIASACTPFGVGARTTGNGGSSNTAIKSSTLTDKLQVIDNFDFNLIPNPTNGSFKVVLNNNSEYPTSVSISNVLGINFYQNYNRNSYEIDVDLNTAPNGIYIVQVNYNGKIISKRIIKN